MHDLLKQPQAETKIETKNCVCVSVVLAIPDSRHSAAADNIRNMTWLDDRNTETEKQRDGQTDRQTERPWERDIVWWMDGRGQKQARHGHEAWQYSACRAI